MKDYVEHFGDKSMDYLLYRPHYPKELFHYLATHCSHHELAWDCGTGNGQAAVQLAKYFQNVIATDINQSQLEVAIQNEKVLYYCWPSEQTALDDGSVDIVTVAQALHWFDLPGFYKEVRRVSKHLGLVAAWCYSLGSMNYKIDALIKKLYSDILGDTYWPKERCYIDDEYQSINFPFEKIKTPQFSIEKNLSFGALIGYLNTWSAVKEYQKVNDDNPINQIFAELQEAWGDPANERIMRWPIHLLIGRVD